MPAALQMLAPAVLDVEHVAALANAGEYVLAEAALVFGGLLVGNFAQQLPRWCRQRHDVGCHSA